MNILISFGILRWEQKRLHEAVSWFGKAWIIAAQREVEVAHVILASLARVMETMGEEELMVTCRETFEGRKPSHELIREVMEKLRKEKE